MTKRYKGGRHNNSKGKIQKGITIVVGLGEIGKPLLEIIRRHFAVFGVDIGARDFSDRVNVMHICYPYHINNFVGVSANYIKKYNPELTIINSTVLPGTTRAIYKKTGKPIAYSPIRGKHYKMKKDLLLYAKFVAGIDDEATLAAKDHFKAIGMKTKQFSSLESLELAKLLSTTYFGLLIAWAQEVERFCKKFDVDYDEAMSFTEGIDYFPRAIFTSGYIGGHCIIPNIHLLKKTRKSNLLDAILTSNEKKETELLRQGKSLSKRVFPKSIKQ